MPAGSRGYKIYSVYLFGQRGHCSTVSGLAPVLSFGHGIDGGLDRLGIGSAGAVFNGMGAFPKGEMDKNIPLTGNFY